MFETEWNNTILLSFLFIYFFLFSYFGVFGLPSPHCSVVASAIIFSYTPSTWWWRDECRGHNILSPFPDSLSHPPRLPLSIIPWLVGLGFSTSQLVNRPFTAHENPVQETSTDWVVQPAAAAATAACILHRLGRWKTQEMKLSLVVAFSYAYTLLAWRIDNITATCG